MPLNNEALNIALASIPDDVWIDLDITMNENDEFAVLEHEVFDITSSDFLNIDHPPNEGKFNSAPIKDHRNENLYQMHSNSESASPTMVVSSEDFLKTGCNAMKIGASVQSAQLPFLTSSELNEKMEQSVSRLAMSMKRSELSRQRILQNGTVGCNASMFTNLIGTSSTFYSGISQSRRVVGSYMNHVGNNSM